MGRYRRVLPRDLFNESNLLHDMGKLWIAIEERRDHEARIVEEHVDGFDVVQDEGSGDIELRNVTFTIRGVRHRLARPLNSPGKWSLLVDGNDDDPDFEPVAVFDGDGRLTAEMLALIGADRTEESEVGRE